MEEKSEVVNILYPSLWISDYADLKHNAGFGVLILDENREAWVLHFNKHWGGGVKYRSKNTKKDDFVKLNKSGEELLLFIKSGNFKLNYVW